MAFLKRAQVKKVVIDALKVIADVPENVEAASLSPLTDQQEHIFLSALKSKLNSLPYIKNNGSTTFLAYYDINLTPDSVDEWPTVKDAIDWIVANQKVVFL